METVRDLVQDDPWRESLERSHARRARSEAKRKRDTTVALGARGIIWLLLVGAFVTMALDDGAPQVSPASAHGDVTGLASAHGSSR